MVMLSQFMCGHKVVRVRLWPDIIFNKVVRVGGIRMEERGLWIKGVKGGIAYYILPSTLILLFLIIKHVYDITMLVSNKSQQ